MPNLELTAAGPVGASCVLDQGWNVATRASATPAT